MLFAFYLSNTHVMYIFILVRTLFPLITILRPPLFEMSLNRSLVVFPRSCLRTRAHTHTQVEGNLRHLPRLTAAMRLVDALLSSKHAYVAPYVHALMPPILTCIVGRRLCADPAPENPGALRCVAPWRGAVGLMDEARKGAEEGGVGWGWVGGGQSKAKPPNPKPQ